MFPVSKLPFLNNLPKLMSKQTIRFFSSSLDLAIEVFKEKSGIWKPVSSFPRKNVEWIRKENYTKVQKSVLNVGKEYHELPVYTFQDRSGYVLAKELPKIADKP